MCLKFLKRKEHQSTQQDAVVKTREYTILDAMADEVIERARQCNAEEAAKLYHEFYPYGRD